jgi:hypothetical protein
MVITLATSRKIGEKIARYLGIHGQSRVARDIEACFFFNFKKHLACSHIWLNLSRDDHHFGYITKLTPKIIIIIITLKYKLCSK